jgi:hypothetical protein
MRITVDTAADYERAKLLYAERSRGVSMEFPANERFCGGRVIETYRRLFPHDAT